MDFAFIKVDQRDVFGRTPIRKRAPIALKGQQIFFLFSILVFLATCGTWIGVYLYAGRVLNQNSDLRSQIASFQEDLDPNLLKELISISNKLASARALIQKHTITSSVFEFLEKNTHPKVSYSSIGYSSQARTMDFAATAANFAVLARQISVFESSQFVEKVTFGGLSLNEKGDVGFKLGITFRPELIRIR